MIERIIRFKVYFDRSKMYIAYIQFIMMLMIMLKVYEDTAFGAWFFSHWWKTVAFIVLFFAFAVFVGYLDKKFIRGKEQKEIISTNPIFMEMKEKVDKMYEYHKHNEKL